MLSVSSSTVSGFGLAAPKSCKVATGDPKEGPLWGPTSAQGPDFLSPASSTSAATFDELLARLPQRAPTVEPTLLDMATSGGRPHEMTAPQVAAVRQHLETNYYDFAYIIGGCDVLYAPLHSPLCQLVERWGTTIDYKRMMVQIPRGALKSTLLTRTNALWRIVKDRNTAVAIFNEKIERVERWLLAIQSIVAGNPLFHALWRDLIPAGIAKGDPRSRSKSLKWSAREMLFERDQHGIPELSITAMSVGGASAGGHWPWLIHDDLISVEAQQSQVVMRAVKSWFDTSIFLGPSPETMNAWINCTRWHYDDVYEHARRFHAFRLYRRAALEDGASTFPKSDATKGLGWTTAELLRMQERQPMVFACTPAGTKITMEDWTLKNIEDVRVGDSVVGFTLGRERCNSRLTPSEVSAVGHHQADVWEYALADGKTVRCTKDHQWYRGLKHESPYIALGDLTRFKSNRPCLFRVHDIFDFTQEERLWGARLGGLFDGEGSVTAIGKKMGGGVLAITQSPEHNPEVYQSILETLDRCGFKYGIYHRAAHTSNGRSSKASALIHIRALGNGEKGHQNPVKFRFLEIANPAKRHQIVKTMWISKWVDTRVPVVGRRLLGSQTVYWLQTKTGNYIADGYASKNCQMQNQPMAGENTAFDIAKLCHCQLEVRGDVEGVLWVDHNPDQSVIEEEAPAWVPLRDISKMLFVDPAPSVEGERNREPDARNALVMRGCDAWGRRYWLDVWAGREGPIERAHRIIRMLLYWGTTRLGIEEVAAQKEIIPWCRDLARREYKDPIIQYTPLKPGRRDKDSRIAGLAGSVAGGWEGCLDSCRALVVEEASTYPYGKTRDILDAAAYDRDEGCLGRPESPDEIEEREYQQYAGPSRDGRDLVTGY